MSEAVNLLPVVAVIVGLGVGAQVLADRFRVPSVIFLITAGVVIGPEGMGLVTRSVFTAALTTIVGVSVAIIVFEGAFNLDVERLRSTPATMLKLVTLGAGVALVGTAATVHFVLGAGWGLSLLVGALLVATGPTVITPILDVVHVRERVALALETEGIVNDVTAAVLAVAMFEAVTLQETDPSAFVEAFVGRIAIGVLVGSVIAGIVWYLLTHLDLPPRNAPQNARLLVLAGAIIAHGSAEAFTGETGIAAAATAGVLLANADLPHEESIREFKDDVTLLVLSFVFVTLAALIEIDYLLSVGIGGLIVVLVIMLVVRPLTVFLSTAGEPFSREEKVFMSAVAPRGIVPAGVATLFALRIQQSNPEASTLLAGTVFLVIVVTVTVEGGLARHVAELLAISPRGVIIVGGGTVGRTLARRYEERGERVELVEMNPQVVDIGRGDGFVVHAGDGTDPDVLRKAGADTAKRLVAVTDGDDVNLRVAQLASRELDIDTVVARVNDPYSIEAFEELGVRMLPGTPMSLWATTDPVGGADRSDWLTELVRGGDVREIEVTSSVAVRKTIADIETELPPRCFIAAVRRGDDIWMPDECLTIESGDVLTVIGRKDAIGEILERRPLSDGSYDDGGVN